MLFPELSLVDEAQIRDSLIVRSLSGRLEAACGTELQTLQMRVAFLLGTDEIDSADNPLGPAAICEALKDICWVLEEAGDARKTILDLLVTRLADELGAIFREANALLVVRKVMPELRPRARRIARRELGARRAGGPLAQAEKRTNEIIQHLLSTKEGSFQQTEYAIGADGPDLMDLLTRLQKGETDAALGDTAFSLPANASGSTNFITALLDAGVGKRLGAVDALVIDVVATVFDYIFDDTRVPEPIKGLIGRLQIPVLKLAMIDHSFFANRAHPARRLINALAHAGATWDGAVTPETSLHRSAEAIVLRIQNEFAADTEVFAQCQQEFDRYLAEQESRADARAATLTERLKERERHELARDRARDAIAGPLANPQLPNLLRDFIGSTWHKVLTRALLEGGDEGSAWREALATLEDLVWSVMPKQDADARQKMVQRLPGLLRGVKAGMQVAGIDEAEQKGFFSDLVQFHAAALKAGMAQGASAPPAAAAKAAGRSSVMGAIDEPTPGSLELDLLSRGNWIELRDESGDIRRVRLTWISPARTMYLFANRQGQRALALTRSELTRRFASGEAATAIDEPLLDRVVDDALDDFQR
jgi:hypothetical protein